MSHDENAYGHTRYYRLPLYRDDTPIDLRDGYNCAMALIDKKLHQLDVRIAECDSKEITR